MLFGLILIVALLRWAGLLTWVRLKPPARPAAAGENTPRRARSQLASA